MIPIKVNGEPVSVAPECTVVELLRQLAIAPERVAVELNREIVRKPDWAETKLEAGAELEIVQFVGGG